MASVMENIRKDIFFRGAIAAPIFIMIIFSAFNLTGVPDQSRLQAAFDLAVVNLDEAAPGAPAPLSDGVIAGLEARIPVPTVAFGDEAEARAALDAGDVSAVLVMPAVFSESVRAGEAVTIVFVTSHHLSTAENQLAASLARQIEASVSAAMAGIRLANAVGDAGGAAAGASANIELLYTANNASALAAPFIMTFATWLAAFVGALLAFLATRPYKGPAAVVPVSVVRTTLAVAVPAAASLALAVVVAWNTDNWGSLVSLWVFIWLATAAIALLMAGMFAVFGFVGILIGLPLAFYQGALSGTLRPIDSTVDWLQNLAEALPFDRLGTAYRTLVIGGPDSLPILTLIAVGIVGLALIWVGTWLYHQRGGTRPAEAAPAERTEG